MRIVVYVVRIAVCTLVAVLALGCRPAPRAQQRAATRLGDPPVARGAVLYATYCAGCHGRDGRGDGPVAGELGLHAANLREPALLARSDAEIVDRIISGEGLRTHPRRADVATGIQVGALEAYVLALDGHPWARIRAGRFFYESQCGPCHGAYGTGEGAIGMFLPRGTANLPLASARYTDPALVGVIRRGVGAMPAMDDVVTPEEVRQIVAYVRLLSPGHRLYDTYCASCHGDDGKGADVGEPAPQAASVPPLDIARLKAMPAPRRRTAVLHMFERAQGLMPHFRGTLDGAQLTDVVAYLRTTM
ncbi:MAG TPA: c-type cytochrome [Candidatus Binatia bacterium]|jgi:mono/diheme cytochrome c family protein